MTPGSVIYDVNGIPQGLGELVGKGGEGQVFALDSKPRILVKLFHERSDRATLERKISVLFKEQDLIQNPRLAWPQISVYDDQKRWLGYAMRRGNGTPLSRLAHARLYKKYFPTLNRLEIVTLLLDLVKVVGQLHNRNICLGDINLDNILYDYKSHEITLIDTDSFQLKKGGYTYACPVGKAEMTPPEHLSKDFKSLERTVESDLFSLAILMFQCLMLGRHPYDIIGGGDPIENLKAGNFPYGQGGARPGTDGAIPAGPWYIVWSHLTFNVKTLFIRTFGEGASDPKKRATLAEWCETLEKYKYALSRGYNAVSILPPAPKESKPDFC